MTISKTEPLGMKALIYYLAEKLRFLENSTCRIFKHARVFFLSMPRFKKKLCLSLMPMGIIPLR